MAPQGFTLIEMLIVLAIIGIILAVVLGGQSGFSRTLGLNNTAYDIGLTIRQSQSYGLSSQAYETVTCPGLSVLNNVPYGVYLQGSTNYLMFADSSPCPNTNLSPDKATPGDGFYKAGNDQIVQTYNLNNGYTIPDFSVVSTSGKQCAATGQAPLLTGMAITFARPNVETTIYEKTSQGWSSIPPGSEACVEVASAQGDTRFVTVSQTGQVQVGNASTVDPSGTFCPPCSAGS